MNIPDTIAEEIVFIWRKPNTNPVDRANFLYELKISQNLSDVEFCDKYDIPIGTFKGWMVYRKLSRKQYDYLESKSISKRHIHETLKSTKYSDKEAVKYIEDTQEEDCFMMDLDTCIKILRPYIKNKIKLENNTMMKLHEIKNIINKLERGL